MQEDQNANVVVARLDPLDAARLHELAPILHCTVGKIVRAAVARFLESYEGEMNALLGPREKHA